MRISDWSSDVCSSWALLQVLEQQPEADASINNVLRDIRQSPHADKTIRQLLDTSGSMIRTYLYPADMANSWQRDSTFDDRKSVVSGKRVTVRGDLGGRCIIKKKQI